MESNYNETQVEKGLTLFDLWVVFKKYFAQIIVFTLIATIAAGIASYLLVKRKYTATTKIIINASSIFDASTVNTAYNNRTYALSLFATIQDVLTNTNKVSLNVKNIDKAAFKEWCEKNNGSAYDFDGDYAKNKQASISVSHQNEDSLLFTISFTTTESAEKAIGTANAIAYGLIEVSLEEKEGYVAGANDGKLEKYVYPFGGMLSPIQLSTTATGRKNWYIYPIIAFAAAFVLLYLYFLLLSIFDDSVKSKAEIEDITGFNVIAFIEDVTEVKTRKKKA